MIIKLILICLSNSFFNFFIKMKNEKRTVFRFPFFYENEKRMKILKIQRKNLLNMKMVVNYLNFVFLNEVKSKSKYRILNFVFEFIKNTKWHFGYTDWSELHKLLRKIKLSIDNADKEIFHVIAKVRTQECEIDCETLLTTILDTENEVTELSYRIQDFWC